MPRQLVRMFFAALVFFSYSTARCAESVPSTSPIAAVPLLAAEEYRTGWIEGDCAYHAARVSGDGKVYFTVSCHLAQASSRLYVFDPLSRKIRLLWTVDQTIPHDGSVTHGKIHSPVGEMGNELFVATHDAWYHSDHTDPATGKVQAPYKGGQFIAIDKSTGKGRWIATPLPNHPAVAVLKTSSGIERVEVDGQAFVTAKMDEQRGLFYGLSWPSGYFVKVDVKTGQVSDYGNQTLSVPVPLDASLQEQTRFQFVPRTLALDKDGNVYGPRLNGEIWKYDPWTDRIVILKAHLNSGIGAKPPPGNEHMKHWRTIVWDDKDKVFYGVHHATSWLFRFDPKAEMVEPVICWRPKEMKDKPGQLDSAQLGLAMGPNHTLYGLVHAPALRPAARRSVRLITFNLDTRQFKDHGALVTAEGLTVMFSETCAVAPNGDVYTVAWVEAEPSMRSAINAARKDGPAEVGGHEYLMSLVRVPAEHIKFDP